MDVLEIGGFNKTHSNLITKKQSDNGTETVLRN